MLLDPGQVVGHIGVHTRPVAITTARAPADDASKDQLAPYGLVLTHQRAPGVTLGWRQAAQCSWTGVCT